MKTLYIIPIFFGIITSAYGQISTDSLAQKKASASQSLDVDSLSQKLVLSPDAVASFKKMDFICNGFHYAADSLQTKYQKAISNIDAKTRRITVTIDSLQGLRLSTSKYAKTLDSLNRLQSTTVSKLKSKLDSLKSKTIDKLNGLDLPPEYKEPLSELNNKINRLTLNSGKMTVDELNIPGYPLPSEGFSSLTEKASNLSGVNMPHLQAGDVAGQVQNEIKTVVPDNGDEITRHVQEYQRDIKNISEGKLADLQKLPETLESEASKMEGIDELQKQSGVIAEHKASLEDLKDSEGVKKKAVEIAKKAAVDHFAGKQEQLKAAMERISKYKLKYSSVSSIKDLPKRPPNAMKGKPFIERLVPGLYLQYQQKGFYLIDVNPYVGYKISGRLSSGLGWNHRYAWDDQDRELNSKARIFGPRAYVDLKLGRGFIAHLEEEVMNTFVPSTLVGNPDTGQREWVWNFMTGLKKEYKIYRNLKGTALIQYNWFNRYYKAPYADRLNSRIGFEYTIKKAKGKSNKQSKQ